MNRRLILPLIILLATSLPACTPEEGKEFITQLPGQSGDSTGNDIEQEEEQQQEENNNNMASNTITLTVNGRSFTATLAENSSAKALAERLTQGVLTIQMDDYGNMEKVGALGFSLPRNDIQTTTSPGDIILYQGNSLVIYYDTNAWRFTRLGKVDNVSTREQMLELLGGKGKVSVTVSLQ